MKTETKQAIDRLNQVIDDYINIFNTDKKEIKEIEQSLKVLIKKTESEGINENKLVDINNKWLSKL